MPPTSLNTGDPTVLIMKAKLALLAFLLLLLPAGFAAFPYNAKWLKYADMRLVYKIDISGVTSNEPNIYVTVDIDPTVIQEYIDSWGNICDEANKYDWFYPTFTYASTQNSSQRMLKVVEYNNWQTFTVGTCGSIELPTHFVLLLPDGVLDGGGDYQYIDHYVYAYFKYPYADDFYDNPVGYAPDEYYVVSGSPIIEYTKSWPRGHYLNHFGARVRIPRTFTVDLSKPFLFCYSGAADSGGPTIYVKVPPNEYRFDLPSGEKCTNISTLLRNQGLSGTVDITYIDLSYYGWGIVNWAYLDYVWPIPQSVFRRILYGS